MVANHCSNPSSKQKKQSRKVVNEHMPLLKMVRIRRAQIADSTTQPKELQVTLESLCANLHIDLDEAKNAKRAAGGTRRLLKSDLVSLLRAAGYKSEGEAKEGEAKESEID